MERQVTLRFRGLATTSGGTSDKLISQVTGFTLQRDGEDWIVPPNDPKLMAGPDEVLVVGDPIHLSVDEYPFVADTYASYLVRELEDRGGEKPRNIEIFRRYGLVSDIESQQYEFFFSSIENLKQVLVTKTIPFVVECFQATSAIPLKVKASYQQSLISLAKISLLASKFDSDEVRRRVFQRDVLSGLIPTPIDIFAYVEALTLISPYVMSIPMHRMGSSLNFIPQRVVQFPRIASENVFERMSSFQEPLTANYLKEPFESRSFTAHGLCQYFKLAVEAVNTLLKYINDPRNFVTPDGFVDHQKFLQTQSAVRLIFTEVASISYTNSFYLKQKLSFSVLDKVANLRKHLGKSKKDEDELFRELLAIREGDAIAKILKHHFRRVSAVVAGKMAKLSHQTFRQLHTHLEEVIGRESEVERLEYLRAIRNTEHGTFLRRHQFEKVFLESEGSVPPEIMYVPFLVVWALALEPRKFLEG